MLPIKNLFGFRKNNELDKSTIQKNPNKNNTDLNKGQFIKKGLLGMAGLGGLALASKVAKAGGLVFNDGSTQTAGSLEGTSILSTGETGGTKFLREDGDGTTSWQAGGGDYSDGGEAGGAARTLGNTDAYDFALETNNVEQLQIEGDTNAGIITMPNQSACSVRKTGQTITTGTITKIQFSTEVYDIQGEFDSATNYRFTATNAGKYLFLLQADIDTLGDGKNIQLYCYFNGTRLDTSCARINRNGASGTLGTTYTIIIALNATDYLEGFISHDHGSDRGARAWLTISKIA